MIYDFTIDMLKLLFVSLEFLKPYATIGGVLFLILRQNGIKKVINGKLPRRFRDTHDSDTQEMKQDIKEMKYDIKLLKNHGGVVGEWSSTQLNGLETTPTLSYKRFFLFLQAVTNQKRRVSKMNLSGKKKILAVGVAILINGCNDVFKLGLTPATINAVSALGGGYVLVEAVIDIVRAWANRTKEVVVVDAIPTINGSSDK